MTLIEDEITKNIHEAQKMINESSFSFTWNNFSEFMEERTRENSHKTFLIYYDDDKEPFQFGWFRNGDEDFYKLDKQKRKFFFITGRIKELIIRGGINILTLEIDDVL